MIILQQRYCRSRWRVLFDSAPLAFLHMDSPLWLNMDTFKENVHHRSAHPIPHAGLERRVVIQRATILREHMLLGVRRRTMWKKDTLLHVLGQLLYLAGVARHLLCHHKQQVGVVYPLGVNQPAEKERERQRAPSTTPPLLTYITHSFANGSVRFMRQSYKAHLVNDMTISLKLIRLNHQRSLLTPTERRICLANCVSVTAWAFAVFMCRRVARAIACVLCHAYRPGAVATVLQYVVGAGEIT